MVVPFPVIPEVHINFVILNAIPLFLFYFQIKHKILSFVVLSFIDLSFTVFEKKNNFVCLGQNFASIKKLIFHEQYITK